MLEALFVDVHHPEQLYISVSAGAAESLAVEGVWYRTHLSVVMPCLVKKSQSSMVGTDSSLTTTKLWGTLSTPRFTVAVTVSSGINCLPSTDN